MPATASSRKGNVTPKLSPRQLRCKLVVKNTFLEVEGGNRSRCSSGDVSPMRRACSDPEIYESAHLLNGDQPGEDEGWGSLILTGLDDEDEAGSTHVVGLEGVLQRAVDEDETASDVTNASQQPKTPTSPMSPMSLALLAPSKDPFYGAGLVLTESPHRMLQPDRFWSAPSDKSPQEAWTEMPQPKPTESTGRRMQNKNIHQQPEVAPDCDGTAAAAVRSGPDVDHLASENARLMMENMLLKQQCLAVASAAQTAANTAANAAARACSDKTAPMRGDESPSTAAQYTQAMHMRSVAQMALMAGVRPDEVFSSGIPLQGLPSQYLWAQMQAGGLPHPSSMSNAMASQSLGQTTEEVEDLVSKTQAALQMVAQSQKRASQSQGSVGHRGKGKARPVGPQQPKEGGTGMSPVGMTCGYATQPQQGSASVGNSSCGNAGQGPTTVMLRNLPNQYTRAMILDLIDSEGFAGLYDFINLPIDFKSRSSLGYAFVNLVSHEVANRFRLTFDGFSEWIIPSRKVCGVTWSGPHQGLQAHIERYQNSPVMHESVPDMYKPAIFTDGKRVQFPPPTRKLRPPRMRPVRNGNSGSDFAMDCYE